MRPTTLLEPKRGAVYGPVRSRRLGWSLGVNPFPGPVKVCSFDCVYCQYGWTRGDWQRARIDRAVDVDAAVSALIAALGQLDEPPDAITLSGNGEPTLHPRFPELVAAIARTRDRLASTARLAVLSNASTVTDGGVRDALFVLDDVYMKLDAGTDPTFASFNRPAAGLPTLDQVTDALATLPGVTLQCLLAGGPRGNAGDTQISAWLERVDRIAPAAVQVYTISRATPVRSLEPLPRALLHDLHRQAGARCSRPETEQEK